MISLLIRWWNLLGAWYMQHVANGIQRKLMKLDATQDHQQDYMQILQKQQKERMELTASHDRERLQARYRYHAALVALLRSWAGPAPLVRPEPLVLQRVVLIDHEVLGVHPEEDTLP